MYADSTPSEIAVMNLKDANGWTAMHFAAGANSVEAVRILVQHGAAQSVEAANGYTPLQWAVRLQNQEVAEELRRQALMGRNRLPTTVELPEC